MNRIARLSLSGLALAALMGCGAPAPEEQAEAEPDPGSQEAEETVFDDMIQTQDRARAVEGVVLDHKKDLDAAIDHSEDATSGE
jgi:hypothetical protein